MTDYRTAALDSSTWPQFERLLASHSGVWGGCWCLAFHAEGADKGLDADARRETKRRLVEQSRAHAALVLEGDRCVGWCQFGSPAELPRIKHRSAYDRERAEPPDWRITCFFVGTGYRRTGVAGTALRGALERIAVLGGGVVEAYPDEVAQRRVSSSFLWSGTVPMFEAAGFRRLRQLGKHTWVVSREVAAVG